MVASDRVSVFDVVLPDEIPDKGRVLTGALALLVRADRRTSSRTTSSRATRPTSPRRPAQVAGRADARAGDTADPARVRRARLPVRRRLEASTPSAARSAASRRRRGCEQADQAARAAVHADDEGRDAATTCRSPPTKRSRSSAPSVYERLREALAAALRARRAPRRSVRAHPGRHEVRVRRARRRDPRHRRDDDARLVALLAARARTRPGTSPPSFDKQFVRDFMDSTGWNHEPPAPHMPADVIANTRAQYVEAYELRHRVEPSPTGTGPTTSRSVRSRSCPRSHAHVEVTHLPGIADPAGATVERALPALGYTNVSAGAHRQDDPPRGRRTRRRSRARSR